MSRTAKMVFIIVTTMFIVACNLFTPKAPNAQSPASTVPAINTQAPPTEPPVPSDTAAPTAQPAASTATPTLAPVPTDTAQPASTSAATAIPLPSSTVAPAATPLSGAQAAPTTDAAASMAATALAAAGFKGGIPTMDPTTQALLGPMADVGDITQYYNPTGTPLQSWNGVPIMPQATAGQEFKADVYSYKATATLNQATDFYAAKAASIGLPPYHSTGYGGRGNLASHNATFLGLNLKLIVDIVSLDDDPQHVIVIINKAP